MNWAVINYDSVVVFKRGFVPSWLLRSLSFNLVVICFIRFYYKVFLTYYRIFIVGFAICIAIAFLSVTSCEELRWDAPPTFIQVPPYIFDIPQMRTIFLTFISCAISCCLSSFSEPNYYVIYFSIHFFMFSYCNFKLVCYLLLNNIMIAHSIICWIVEVFSY